MPRCACERREAGGGNDHRQKDNKEIGMDGEEKDVVDCTRHATCHISR
jgi:hypothetical protein